MKKLRQLVLLFTLLAWCAPAQADIALSGTASQACIGGTPWTPVTISAFAVTNGDLILVGVHQRNEVVVDTVSGGGLTWTSIADVDHVDGYIGVALWRATATSTTSFDITVALPSNNQAAYVIAQAFSGVDTATNDGVEAVASTAGISANDNDMLFSVTTVTANAWAVAVGSTLSANLTIPGEETAIITNTNDTCTTFSGHMWYQGPVVTPASTQLGALNDLSAATDWCMIVVSLKPSSGAAPARRRVAVF